MPNKPILCLDFDGVLHSYTSGWKGADVIPNPPVDGAIAFLYDAIKYFDVQIFSSRSNQDGGIEAMETWLYKWEAVWREEQPAVPRTCLALCIKFPKEKPPAFLSIDDRALTFEGVFHNPKDLLTFRPWNRRGV